MKSRRRVNSDVMPLPPSNVCISKQLMRLTKTLRVLVVILVAGATVMVRVPSICVSGAGYQQQWPKFTGQDEEFSVRMPRKPWLYLDLITTPSGKQVPERIYSSYSKGAVYLVVSYDGISLKGTFENFKLHHCSQAEVTFVRDNTLSGYAGKEYSLKFGDVTGILSIYVTKKHGYAVVMVQANDDARLRDYFLSTFSLSKTGGSTDANLVANVPPAESSDLPSADSSEIALGVKQVTRKAVVVSKPEPWYTDDARRASITGAVVLRAVFSSSGEVTNIHVVRGLSKGLTENAIDAAKHLTFIPAIKDGRFVSYWMELQYNFGLY
jgi:TonB family protein